MPPLENQDNAVESEIIAPGGRLEIRKPAECTKTEKENFAALVNESDEVDPDRLAERIERAESLAFYYLNDRLVAVGALKNRKPEYRRKVFAKAGSDNEPEDFPLELGWLYTAKEARGKGLAKNIIAALIENAAGDRIFATTRSNNLPIHKLFEKTGFRRSGTSYGSGRGDYSLVLYVRTP
jgi:GNAT superfamily N-acetyltransferase